MTSSTGKTSEFIKIKDHIYISKNDPNFFQKLMEKIPALQMEFDKNRMHPVEAVESVEERVIANSEQTGKKSKMTLLLARVIASIALALFYQVISIGYAGDEAIETATIEMASAMSPEQSLKVSLVRTAIDRFYEAKGRYPESLTELAGQIPNNWLSVIPSGLNYGISDQQGYYVVPDGFDPRCACQPENLSLAFFPSVNQLALMQGDEVLSLYPVASGAKGNELPYEESNVTTRVFNPNNGKSVFGKYALALTQNYAIHGTNQEQLIGERVSHGCLRMTANHIEELYPYVPQGTLFKVAAGQPGEPKYKDGLPPLGGQIIPDKETVKQTFHWNG